MDAENPLMLCSEHKRILAACQERYDRQLRKRFWQGVAASVWPAGFAILLAAITGFNCGLGLIRQ